MLERQPMPLDRARVASRRAGVPAATTFGMASRARNGPTQPPAAAQPGRRGQSASISTPKMIV